MGGLNYPSGSDYPGGLGGRSILGYPRGMGYPTECGAVGGLDYPGGLGYTRGCGWLYLRNQLSYPVGW